MTKISEKKLIGQIKELKEIKPRPEWVILTKSEIFNGAGQAKKVFSQNNIIPGFKLQIPSFFFPKKLAYSFVALIFIFVGLIGFANNTVPGDLLFPIKKIAENSTAALSGETLLKQNLTTLNHRINDLTQVAKEGKTSKIPYVMSEVNANASALAESLKKEPVVDFATMKEIAINLKTLADVFGTDLTESSDMKNLYQAVIENQIADMEKSTLTEEQEKIFMEIKELYSKEKYSSALEMLLTINQTKSNQTDIDSDVDNGGIEEVNDEDEKSIEKEINNKEETN